MCTQPLTHTHTRYCRYMTDAVFCILQADFLHSRGNKLDRDGFKPSSKMGMGCGAPRFKKKKKKTHTQLYKYGPECNTLIFSNLRAFIHELRSVTYHLPLDFWTSLLLKLCDLAVPLVYRGKKKKAQNCGGHPVCVFMGGRGRKTHSKVHFVCALCLCLCTLGSIKQVAAYSPAVSPKPPPGSPPPTQTVLKLLSSDSRCPSHICFEQSLVVA